jgi:hypothetical protein
MFARFFAALRMTGEVTGDRGSGYRALLSVFDVVIGLRGFYRKILRFAQNDKEESWSDLVFEAGVFGQPSRRRKSVLRSSNFMR